MILRGAGCNTGVVMGGQKFGRLFLSPRRFFRQQCACRARRRSLLKSSTAARISRSSWASAPQMAGISTPGFSRDHLEACARRPNVVVQTCRARGASRRRINLRHRAQGRTVFGTFQPQRAARTSARQQERAFRSAQVHLDRQHERRTEPVRRLGGLAREDDRRLAEARVSVAATGINANSGMVPTILNRVLGMKIKIVMGYPEATR